jgi:MYXO-CTERM domain-containing protein
MLPEDRNALYLTFVAGVRDAVQPAPPPPPAPANPPTPGTGGGMGNGSGGGNGATGGTAGTPGTPGTAGTPGSSGHFSSGCSVAFGGAESSTGGALILLGLAILMVARRRWS